MNKPAGPAGLFDHGAPMLLVDSITEAAVAAAGSVVVSGSHAGISVVRYISQARPRLAVLNDAGGGKDGAGIAALPLLQALGIAACTVSHHSARIGDARSTLDEGVVSHVNEAAAALGGRPGLRVCDWLFMPAGSGSSPARR